jgi:gliding motility-associated-like protein
MRYIKLIILLTVFLLSENLILAQACITLTSGTGTNNQTVCLNLPIVNITYSLGAGVINATVTGIPPGVIGTYSPGLYTISGIPSSVGNYNYTVTTEGICTGTPSASGSIIVNPSPVASALNNGPVCEGKELSLTGGPSGMIAYSWTGPNGYSNATQSPVVSTSATTAMAGLYSLTVTNSFGCQNTASTNAIVNSAPVATAANNGPVCVGSTLQLIGGPIGMASYAWTGPNGFTSNIRSPIVSNNATLAMAGKYILTATNGNGCQDTASTRVYVYPVPVPTANNNGPVCSGTQLRLTGGPDGMATYSWTGPDGFTSSLQSPVVSEACTIAMSGIYTLIVTNSAGCQGTTTTSVIVNQSPLATASNNGPVCTGSLLTLRGGPAGMTSYGWTGPDGFTSTLRSPTVSLAATVEMAGVYLLTVTNATGCQDTASTRVYVYEVPVANAGRDTIECDLIHILNAVPSVGTGLWSVASGPGPAIFTPNASAPNATVRVTAYGTYTFRWTETNGTCSSSDLVTVIFYQSPIANAGEGGDACDLDFELNAVPSAGTGTWTMITGTGTAVFAPSANSPTVTVTVSEYGTKEFQWKEENGLCSDSSSITVNFYEQPSANAGTGGNNCGSEFILNAVPSVGTGTWTRVSGPGSATFTPNAHDPSARVRVSAYGTYVFRWTEVNGSCSSSATITVVFIQQPAADAGNGGDECDLNFQFNATPAVSGTSTWTKVNGPGNVTFTPNANQYNAVVTVTQFGSYDFEWKIENSLCSSSDIIRVTFHDIPDLNAGDDVLLCKGNNIQLNATGSGTFLWSPAGSLNNSHISNPIANPDETTLYTVTLTDQWGCVNDDQVNVEVREQPVANAGPDQELDFLFETDLEGSALGDNQTGAWTILAGSGDLYNINDPTTHVSDLALDLNSFIWTVTNEACPVSSDTVNILVNNLIIPTLITPNLDGINDYFIIKGIESFGHTSLTIFNRWGARVYENKEYDNSWYGMDDNENLLPEDTYFFILIPEKSRTLKGYVVIRR